MLRSASEMVRNLEMRIARLERTAGSHMSEMEAGSHMAGRGSLFPHRPRGVKNYDIQDIATRAGYPDVKVQYTAEDFPVVVLAPSFYVFLDNQGYTIEYPTGGTSFTYKFSDVKSVIARESANYADFGSAGATLDTTPTYDDVQTLLQAEGGWMAESWLRARDNMFVGGDFALAVKLTPMAIKWSLTQGGVEVDRGMSKGADRESQLTKLALDLDDLAMTLGKRRARARKQALRALKDMM
jgi:hypothetical protein